MAVKSDQKDRLCIVEQPDALFDVIVDVCRADHFKLLVKIIFPDQQIISRQFPLNDYRLQGRKVAEIPFIRARRPQHGEQRLGNHAEKERPGTGQTPFQKTDQGVCNRIGKQPRKRLAVHHLRYPVQAHIEAVIGADEIKQQHSIERDHGQIAPA